MCKINGQTFTRPATTIFEGVNLRLGVPNYQVTCPFYHLVTWEDLNVYLYLRKTCKYHIWHSSNLSFGKFWGSHLPCHLSL